MAQPKSPPKCLQLVAVFSRHRTCLEWAATRIEDRWGALALTSDCFDHSETRYYERQMGSQLQKQFFVLQDFYDPAELAASKLESNAWEHEVAQTANFPEQRPVNIDPGYITLTKIVLASAKDRAHRIYLHSGIYAEECLYYLDHAWQSRPWTYPDYQRPDFQDFFHQARDLLRQRIAESTRRQL